MSIIRWRPDTCGCVLDVTPDFATCQAIAPCQAHAQVTAATALTVVHRGENVLKNLAHEAVLSVAGLAADVTPEGETEPVRQLRAGCAFDWSFGKVGEERALTVRIRGARADERAGAAMALDGIGLTVKVDPRA
jgi:hypothetical protein